MDLQRVVEIPQLLDSAASDPGVRFRIKLSVELNSQVRRGGGRNHADNVSDLRRSSRFDRFETTKQKSDNAL